MDDHRPVRIANGAPIFRMSAIGRSIFAVPSNDRDRVKVNALSANDELARNTRRKDAKTFLRDLRLAIRAPAGEVAPKLTDRQLPRRLTAACARRT